jgi:hypothetical protein
MRSSKRTNNSVEQCPSWGDGTIWTGQEIPCTLWNPEVHYRLHKIPPFASILSHLNAVRTSLSYFFQTSPNTILPFTPMSSKRSSCFRFPHQNPVCTFLVPHTYHMSHRLILLNLITGIINGDTYKLWSSILCNFPTVFFYFLPLRLKYVPQHPILEQSQCMFFP